MESSGKKWWKMEQSGGDVETHLIEGVFDVTGRV